MSVQVFPLVTSDSDATRPATRLAASKPATVEGSVAMAAANTHRSRGRSAQILLRFSPEEREQIKQLAQERGLSVQEYADHVLLGLELPAQRADGQGVLPLTG